MAVAHDALLARLGLEIGMLCEKLSNLRFDGLGQQRTRAAAQDLCEGIGKGPWLGELDDVTVRHGVSLLHWRSGGVEHHHDTPPSPVTPSPTSGHSSLAPDPIVILTIPWHETRSAHSAFRSHARYRDKAPVPLVRQTTGNGALQSGLTTPRMGEDAPHSRSESRLGRGSLP